MRHSWLTSTTASLLKRTNPCACFSRSYAPLAFMVALFGGAYAWLARAPRIDRPMVTLAALGKTGFFVVVCAAWLLGEAPGRVVLAAIGDLVFAAIFAWWLLEA